MVRRGRQIASKYAIGSIKTLEYKELQAEAKRCGAPATGTAANLKRQLEAHIKEHGTASEGVLPDSPELPPAQRSPSVSDDGRDDAAETSGSGASRTDTETRTGRRTPEQEQGKAPRTQRSSERVARRLSMPPADQSSQSSASSGADASGSQSSQSPAKAKPKNWSVHHDIRLAEVMDECRADSMMIFGRRSRQEQDAMRGVLEVWDRLAERPSTTRLTTQRSISGTW